MKLNVVDLEQCSRVQVRVGKPNPTVIARYLDSMKAGAIFPPVHVFQEKGTERYIIADGIHRVAAAIQNGSNKIEAELHVGDENDALEFALGANSEHGFQRTAKDIEHAVGMLMSNPAMKAKYRTHSERSDLLRISERTFQRLLAEWREKDGGDEREIKAKEKAKVSANIHTHKKQQVKSDTPPFGSQTRIDPNLRDATRAIEQLCVIPFSGADAVAKFGAEAWDKEKVLFACEWLNELKDSLL